MAEAILTSTVELKYGETTTAMMFYTKDSLIWGDIVHHEEVIPSRILVGITIPEFISIYNAQLIFTEPNFISRPVSRKEIHLPAQKILGYHLLPPQKDHLDYDPTEPNRKMVPLTAFMGAFCIQGSIRISEVTTVKSNIEVIKSDFLTLYDLEIRHNYKTEMQAIRSNMGYFRVRENLFTV